MPIPLHRFILVPSILVAIVAKRSEESADPFKGPWIDAKRREENADPKSLRARVVSVGDLHGDFHHAVSLLQAAGLVDVGEEPSSQVENELPEGAGHFHLFRPNTVRWIGGNATLIQTGDLVDRGTYAKDLYALFIHLRHQAAAAGGQVINLLGNHELMNLQRDWRYVTREDISQFGSVEERKKAFGPDGWIGKDIRHHYKAAAVVADTLFVHAGLTPQYASMGIEALNSAAREALDNPYDGIFKSKGPMWVRHFALGREQDVCPELESTLKLVHARRMVVGHTQVDEGLVRPRCGGRLLMADTIISKDGYPECWGPESMTAEGCQASASYVEIQGDGEAKAVCASGSACTKPSATFESLALFSVTENPQGQPDETKETSLYTV